jgi:hypothetical protein
MPHVKTVKMYLKDEMEILLPYQMAKEAVKIKHWPADN